MHDLEVLWEVPKKPKRVLFVAHGCSHAGSDFWPASPACKHCLGLPEEVAVRQAALKRGYAVVAVTSFNRESGCWHNTAPARSEDLRRLPAILRELLGTQALAKLPLFAFGASSGGSMALRLAAVMPEVEGVVCQISPVNPATLEAEGGRKFPPTLFVHMAQRDPEKAATVEAALKLLKCGGGRRAAGLPTRTGQTGARAARRPACFPQPVRHCCPAARLPARRKAGTPAAEIKVAPQPVTAALLQRAAEISGKQAKAVVAALKKGGALDKARVNGGRERAVAGRRASRRPPLAGAFSPPHPCAAP